jgi:serine/threonine protein kinase
LGEASAIA